jgi:hypothetical protein
MLKKHNIFDIKIYYLCSSLKYTYNIGAYIAKQCKDTTAELTLIHGTIMQLGRRVEDVGHKLYVDHLGTLHLLTYFLQQENILL